MKQNKKYTQIRIQTYRSQKWTNFQMNVSNKFIKTLIDMSISILIISADRIWWSFVIIAFAMCWARALTVCTTLQNSFLY